MAVEEFNIDGFDPLSVRSAESGEKTMLEEANRRIVQNVLKSYTGYFDVFSELIQNSLDAVEKKKTIVGEGYIPRIWIEIDINSKKVRIVDNGVGMLPSEFQYFLTPNVSFKQQGDSRGHKGVGATFIGYGFSLLKAQTKKNGKVISAVLRQGRQWSEDHSGSVPRPTFEKQTFNVPELEHEKSGTSIEVIIGNHQGERPRDMNWIGASTAKQWLAVLRIKTPLGGVYLKTPGFKPLVTVKVVDSDGTPSEVTEEGPEYFYPHEFKDKKVQSLGDIEDALKKATGGADEKFNKLKSEFKRLDVIYEVWDKEALQDEKGAFFSALSEDERILIERHNVILYGSFLRSAKMWTEFNDEELSLRKGQRIMHGGLQMASDFMVQGELSVIPLTSAIGYQANSHVIVHFDDGNPDMGRKVFQPELTILAEKLAVRAVNTFKKYLQHLKPDTGGPVAPDKDLFDWRSEQVTYRDANPLNLMFDSPITLKAKPRQEQDVIALFHQLIGVGKIKGINFYATSQSDRYDSLFFLEYDDHDTFSYGKSNPIGVTSDIAFPYTTEPKVLEYKFDLDALIRDFDRDIKFPKHIDFVVCWKASKSFKEKYFLNSLLIGDEGSSRVIYGATHQAYAEGARQVEFEVLILEDLLNYLQDPESEEARQKQRYSED